MKSFLRPEQAQKVSPAAAGAAHPAVSGLRRRDVQTAAVVDPSAIVDAATAVAAHLPLAYEPVALPCSMMKCGDVLHRSTLDLELRGELMGPDWRLFTLLGVAGAYLFAPPGVLPGAFDFYVLARQNKDRVFTKDDIVLGRKLATGGFGTVFEGKLKMPDGSILPVIVKKAKEFGQAETWMNERMMRIPGRHCAEFITAFDESFGVPDATPVNTLGKGKAKKTPLENDVWLVWKYEGDDTLFDLMESREFPYNLEPLLLDRELRLPKGAQRKLVTIRLVMKQLLEALAAAHRTGIVHRDVKPQNCIVSVDDKKVKLIDLGAAADLRVGINYVPNEYLLDPRYAPPQQYVMSTQTPRPPPAPVAAFLSPILWRMENPDRFDMYSCGVTLLQMAFPTLRTDNGIAAFNKKLHNKYRYDLRAWRREEESRRGGARPELAEGFSLLDEDNGAGWQLLCDLMAYKPADRLSAAEALQSPFFVNKADPFAVPRSALASASKAVSSVLDSGVFSGISDSVTGAGRGALTEAQLQQELGLSEQAPVAPRRASNTIAWWQERSMQQRQSIERRSGGTGWTSGTEGTSLFRQLGGTKGVVAGTSGSSGDNRGTGQVSRAPGVPGQVVFKAAPGKTPAARTPDLTNGQRIPTPKITPVSASASPLASNGNGNGASSSGSSSKGSTTGGRSLSLSSLFSGFTGAGRKSSNGAKNGYGSSGEDSSREESDVEEESSSTEEEELELVGARAGKPASKGLTGLFGGILGGRNGRA